MMHALIADVRVPAIMKRKNYGKIRYQRSGTPAVGMTGGSPHEARKMPDLNC